ncbi:hypothetical protein Nepgr_012774 [Nepenthes gracilis]|uniref:SOSEKI DIX-like domain-containing protein n=1 Tax=Nepenthes gracilis TaxID=150966 RepID=A0AAD3XNE0_NEPGR|nr:hypothetical protein Nepgr_012774 [Nepenthes gracilis]
MEGRMKKYRQVSPERAKVWTEKSPKYVQNRKVPVVYYLCSNRQLEHPHFIEVPLTSPEGLYLRDVIERLNILRGRGMDSMYSWSCKRSYKNGFVWHDLCKDDLIVPAHGNEYVLKGSEILEDSYSGRYSPAAAFRVQNVKQLPEPPSSRSQEETSSSSSLNGKGTKHHLQDEVSPSQRSGSSGVSPESRVGNPSSWGGSLSLTEYKVYNNEGAADAATQTEESVGKEKSRETCTRGVSTDDGSLDGERYGDFHNNIQQSKQNSQICRNSISTPLSSPSESSSGRKTETLESLITADANKFYSSRILEEEDVQMPSHTKLKASSLLMQLISCGSISVKDHIFGLIPTYRPTFSHLQFPSPLYSTSVMLGELDCLSENKRLVDLNLKDKDYFSGSLIETKMLKDGGDGCTSLNQFSSYNADRTSKQLGSADHQETPSARSRCIPQSIKASLSKQPRCKSMRSPNSEKHRISTEGVDEPHIISPQASAAGSARIADPFSGKKPSKSLDSFREEKENIIKIKESLLLEPWL